MTGRLVKLYPFFDGHFRGKTEGYKRFYKIWFFVLFLQVPHISPAYLQELIQKWFKGEGEENFKGGTMRYKSKGSHPAKKILILDDWEIGEIIPERYK